MTQIESIIPATKYSIAKAAGLCPDCKLPVTGTVRCDRCNKRRIELRRLLRYDEKKRELQAERIKNGLCPRCGAASYGERKHCKACLSRSQGTFEKLKLENRCTVCRIKLEGRLATCCPICSLKATWIRYNKSVEGWEKLLKIYEDQGGRCAYTGDPIALGVDAGLDHKLPRSKYPELVADLSNIQWIRRDINRAKNNLTHEEFLALIDKVHANAKR